MSNHHYTLLGENNLRKEKAKKQSYRNWHKNCLFWLIKDSYDSRNSRSEEFYKKGVLKSFAKFTGKQLCQSLFFNKVAGLRHSHSNVFSCEFCEVSQNIFFTEHPCATASVVFITIYFLLVARYIWLVFITLWALLVTF